MSGPRLLIVDDESSIRDMLAIFFHKRGFEVVTASSFAEVMLRITGTVIASAPVLKVT